MAEPLLDQLVDSLRCLPGVGPKSAQRMAFHLLQRNRDGGLRMAELLQMAMERISHCTIRIVFTEAQICRVCADASREQEKLCIVESPSDLAALEKATDYRGLYFVLHGKLSPLDGVGPEMLGLDGLCNLLDAGTVSEVILATNSTVEGEANEGCDTVVARFQANQASTQVDPATEEKIGLIRDRLCERFGYDEASADLVLQDVASLFARSDPAGGAESGGEGGAATGDGEAA